MGRAGGPEAARERQSSPGPGQQAGQHRGGAAADQHLALAGGWEGREEWVEAMKSGKSERRPLKSGKRLRHGCQCRHHDS